MNISNILWNDTQEAKLAYSEQIFDKTINWSSYHYVNKDGITIYPFRNREPEDRIQSNINEIVLEHYTQFQAFLHSKLEPGVIDSWQDIEDFLENISDSETIKLVNIIRELELKCGTLHIEMSEEIPGMLNALNTTDHISTTSKIDDATGEIQIKYTLQ